MKIAGFEIQEKLVQGKRNSLYKAFFDKKDSHVLKVVEKKSISNLNVIHGLKREYRFLEQIDSQYVIDAYRFVDDKDYAVLVLEDIDGKSLESVMATQRLSVDRCVELATMAADGLAAVHKENIIHKDITPANIILNSETGDIKIVDFNISSKFDTKVMYSGNPEKLEGTLPYISPEQTGRMNRSVDQRTDFYSLGVTLYEMLTGEKPFRESDPMEIVYAHLARDPEPPHLLNKEIPDVLSRVVMKLMAKKTEDRYQSAKGLKYDLKKMMTLNYADFKLGEKDYSGTLKIPEKLYGREKEVGQLFDAYLRAGKGLREMVLVAGYSGTGKTSLVNEIHKPVAKDKGYFISGKFDQLQRTIPYSAFIQAFDQFCQLLLTEDRDSLAVWKEKILDAVGDLGKVLTDNIPHMESVIGKQPDIPEVGGDESKSRFNLVFQRLVRAISTKEHPLVMFIDDLQWADPASIDLLQVLMEDKNCSYLFFIGAYRDNEVSAAHPLMMTLEEIGQQVDYHTVPIRNLSIENVREWLWDTLKTDEDVPRNDVTSLADLIYEKTEGNAFFTIQFIDNLYREKFIEFDHVSLMWRYDVDRIEKENMTDNVVDLLVGKIKNMPMETQDSLKLAACIGNVFDFDMLSVISGKTKETHEKNLEAVLIEGLVSPLENTVYKFVHDRIHQAAYSLISDDDKNPLHLKIGRLMLRNFEEHGSEGTSKYSDRHIFDIVNHLNMGMDLIADDDEKVNLVRFNLKAAQNAKTSGAYRLASDYVQKIITLLPFDCWDVHYDLTLAAYNEGIQTSYLNGDIDNMDRFVETVIKHAHEVSHIFTAYRHRSLGLVMIRQQPIQAVQYLLKVFRGLGVDIPDSPEREEIEHLYRSNEVRLKEMDIDSFRKLPRMNHPHYELVLEIFDNSILAFILGGEEAYLFAVLKMLEITIEHGFTSETPHVLSHVGIMKLLWGDVEGAYTLGEISLALSREQSENLTIPYRADLISMYYLLGQKIHYKKLASMLMDIYPQTMNVGDIEFASSLMDNYIALLSRTDMELPKLYEKALDMRDTANQLKQALVVADMECDILAMESLLGKSSNPGRLDCDVEGIFQGVPGQAGHFCAIQGHLKKVFVAYLFENYDDISAHIEAAEKRWNKLNIQIIYTRNDIYFYLPLAYIALYTKTDNTEEKEEFLARAKKRIKSVKEWAEFGPVNFLHRYYLMQAELCRVTGREDECPDYYDKAIETAYENEYINDAALANELAAKFYVGKKKEKLAALYFMEARNCYLKWGAAGKVRHLEENFPKYLTMYLYAPSGRSSTTYDISSSSETSGTILDIKSILKASQTLSGEVHLKPLLEKMMHILIENAGAQKGVLIENRDAGMLVQAEGSTDGVPPVLQAIPLETSNKAPLSVINYVVRSKQQLVFDNISNDMDYSTDSYIEAYQPKSAVCSPVLRKGNVSSIIYLENNLVEGAFTPARLEVLNMLSTQISISIENSELYENLEEKVKKRTLELEESHGKLEESHKKITDSVTYASKVQNAVLPDSELIESLFREYFILYKPHSVVSGDFYWMRKVESKTVVAVADCTGHGVPGALVSMLGIAFLNEIVPSLSLHSQLDSGAILNELRLKTKRSFKQSGQFSDQYEGMDIALCIIDPATRQLQYSGAFNSLCIVRDGELIELKADRMPIGFHLKETPFTTHDIPFRDGDIMYLFTDGFPDQLSEDKLKKFNKKRFKHLLVEVSRQPMVKQKELLSRRFEEWKGDFQQIDDILVIGIRL